MVRKLKASDLPAELKPLFWDVEFGRIHWESHRDFIIGRVLAEGGWEAIQWLVRAVGKDGIREWILHRHGRGLEPRQLRFWELALVLPHRDVTGWIQEQEALPWGRRIRR